VELFKKRKSKFYWYDFTVGGRRYRGSTKESNRTRAAAIAALKLALGAMKAVEPISGIGDEAIVGPMDSILVFTKDGLGVQIDFHQIGGGRDRAIAIAQQMAGRL